MRDRGELACGNLARRTEIIEMLSDLPMLPLADHSEVLYLLHESRPYGTGLGWIEIHLLAATRIDRQAVDSVSIGPVAATRDGLLRGGSGNLRQIFR